MATQPPPAGAAGAPPVTHCHAQGRVAFEEDFVELCSFTNMRASSEAVKWEGAKVQPIDRGPSRYPHICTLLATGCVAALAWTAVWCVKDPGSGRTVAANGDVSFSREPCIGERHSIGMVITCMALFFATILYVWLVKNSALVAMVWRQRRAVALARASAAIDVGAPQVEVWGRAYHSETKHNGQSSSTVEVTTAKVTTPISLSGWANLPGATWADAADAVLAVDRAYIGAVVQFRLALQMDEPAAAAVHTALAEVQGSMRAADERHDVGVRVRVRGVVASAQATMWYDPGGWRALVFNRPVMLLCAAAGLAWPWMLLTEAFTQRKYAVVGKALWGPSEAVHAAAEASVHGGATYGSLDVKGGGGGSGTRVTSPTSSSATATPNPAVAGGIRAPLRGGGADYDDDDDDVVTMTMMTTTARTTTTTTRTTRPCRSACRWTCCPAVCLCRPRRCPRTSCPPTAAEQQATAATRCAGGGGAAATAQPAAEARVSWRRRLRWAGGRRRRLRRRPRRQRRPPARPCLWCSRRWPPPPPAATARTSTSRRSCHPTCR